MIQKPPTDDATQKASVVKKIDWEDFRDHLSTADKEGRRIWIYPRKPRGNFYRARTWFTWVLLAVMFLGPFITIKGEPLLLVDILNGKFSILGQIFWPQDAVILAIGLLLFFMGIAIFTAVYGRLWCGWACPQTVMMEMVFRKIEYLIEGDAVEQRMLARAPWTASKSAKKILKHVIFYALSFIVGNTLLSYLIGWRELYAIVTDNPLNHLTGLAFMVAFSTVFYLIFARFREQACTFICPYGRLQSVLLDENSIVVAYDYKRGEKRAPRHRQEKIDGRPKGGYGDCISCRQCVSVCPTGIDIRNGTQMECVHCTACIDACDRVMDKIDRPRGLIRYASINGIERGERLKATPRLVVYSVILLALISLETFLIFSRATVETTMLRAPGALFQQMPDGKFSNLYTIRLANKTGQDLPVEMKLESPAGNLQIMGGDLVVPAHKLAETSVIIELDNASMKSGKTPLVVVVYSNGKKLETLNTAFIGPRNDTP
ncbi:MAG: cytochrome c oxidase accessory protein CcoG [Limisphaerales bacterium]